MKIKTIIVDDEPLARDRVRQFLQKEPDIEIVRECANGTEAVQAIRKEKPDLVFLDVQMPKADGFDVLEMVGDKFLPIVIFTTAHDEHAVRAFEVHALDYLLKPFNRQRFKQALERARETLQARTGPDPRLMALMSGLKSSVGEDRRVLIKTPDRIYFVAPQEIDFVESAGNYLVLHANQQQHVIRQTLTSFEATLPPHEFMRISRSVVVNLKKIKELQPMATSEYCVILHGGQKLAMTCNLRDLQARLTLP